MPIVKIQKRDPGFVQIDNNVINDPRLTWKAKGILVYLLSKPNNWKVQVTDLINRSSDGEFAVRAALKELIEIGYASLDQARDDKGKVVEWTYTIREVPTTGYPDRGFPDVGFPDVGFPDVGNRDISNKESSNKDLTNTYSGSEEKIFSNDPYEQMRDLVETLTGLMVSPGDTTTLNQWVKDGVTEEDFRGALQWRKDNNLKPAKTISQLAGGVQTHRSMRVQNSNAKPYGKPDLSKLSIDERIDLEIARALER